jgi:5-methylcytosine-specific restriction endonuclease McrA
VTPGSVPEPLLSQLAGQSRHSARAELVRLAVRARAGDACEYCLLPNLGRFQIDHIIPPARWLEYVAGRISGLVPTPGRHGPHHLDNYAWACPICNAAKGRQIMHRTGRRSHRLYDPRRDR